MRVSLRISLSLLNYCLAFSRRAHWLMGPIKLLSAGCGLWEEVKTSSGDGQGLIIALMDVLRNDAYHVCHTESWDVLMCYWGRLLALLQQVASRRKKMNRSYRNRMVACQSQERLNSETQTCWKAKEQWMKQMTVRHWASNQLRDKY